MPWSRPFDDPVTAGGKRLRTLRDAGQYIAGLSRKDQESAEWQAAAEALIMAAEGRGPMLHARIGMLRALNRKTQKAPADPVSRARRSVRKFKIIS